MDWRTSPSSSPGPRNISGLEVGERVAVCCNVPREISSAMTPNVTCSAIVACPNYARDERENVSVGVVGIYMSRA